MTTTNTALYDMRNTSLKAHEWAARFARIGTIYNRLLQRMELLIEDNGGVPTGRQLWISPLILTAIGGLCYTYAIINNQVIANSFPIDFDNPDEVAKAKFWGMILAAFIPLIGLGLGYLAHERTLVSRHPITGVRRLSTGGLFVWGGLLFYVFFGFLMNHGADSGSGNGLKWLALGFAILEVVLGFAGLKTMMNGFYYMLLNLRLRFWRRRLDKAASNAYKYDRQYKDLIMATDPDKAELRLAEHANQRLDQAIAYHLGQQLREEAAPEKQVEPETKQAAAAVQEAPVMDGHRPEPPTPPADNTAAADAEEAVQSILAENPLDNLKF